MIELYYDSYSVAYFIVSQEMGTKTQMEFLENLYEQEYEFLHPIYKGNKKDFISDVLYWTDYLVDKEKLDKEYPVVEKDFKATGRQFIRENMMSDYPEIDMYFMHMRLRILFVESQGFVRMKLRTLLKHYGYKRRSARLNEHLNYCMIFYHIQPYLKDYEQCDIRDVDLDDVIIFRAG